MKTQIYDMHGKKAGEMELPKIFSAKKRVSTELFGNFRLAALSANKHLVIYTS